MSYLAVAHLSVGKPHVFSAGHEPGMRVFRHEGIHIRGGGVEYRVVFFVVAEAVAVEDYEKCFFCHDFLPVVIIYGSVIIRKSRLQAEWPCTENGMQNYIKWFKRQRKRQRKALAWREPHEGGFPVF